MNLRLSELSLCLGPPSWNLKHFKQYNTGSSTDVFLGKVFLFPLLLSLFFHW